MPDEDPFDLARFTDAQAPCYGRVLAELERGEKRTHWMWFIFPQFAGLGVSPTSRHYAIKSPAEARAFLAHPILGSRLIRCCELLLSLEGKSAASVFGSPDDLKLRSCVTLFAAIAPEASVFHRVLVHFFAGQRDERTMRLLEAAASD